MPRSADSAGIPQVYLDWNTALLDYCEEEAEQAGGSFRLVIRRMLEERDVADAEERFVAAVRETYRLLLKHTADPLLRLSGRRDGSRRPACAGFLGLSVLAAEEMEDRNYYERLASLLDQDVERSGVHGLVHQSFQDCWIELATWAEKLGFTFDRPDVGEQTYIRWPKAHALLRRLDIDKLPEFFEQHGYSPLRRYGVGRVEADLKGWVKNFSKPGQRAVLDPVRCEGVVRQTLRALETWAGPISLTKTSDEGATARVVKTVLAYLELRERAGKPVLRFLAPRRPGFPHRIAGSVATWEAADEEAYAPVNATPPLLDRLELGFESGGAFRVRFRGSAAFVFQPSEVGSGLDTSGGDGLPLGVTCAVLCRGRDRDRVANYLASVCETSPPIPILLPGVTSWLLFRGIRAAHDNLAPPRNLEMLRTVNRLQVTFRGGLRTGRPNSWLEGAPPESVEVTGRRRPNYFTLNGEEHPLEPGRTLIAGLLKAPGVHKFQCGGTSRRLTIDPATVRYRDITAGDAPASNLLTPQHNDRTDADRPPGAWTALGDRPGEIEGAPNSGGQTGALRWLVGTDDAGRPSAVALHGERRDNCHVSSTPSREAGRWAALLLTAEGGRLGVVREGAADRGADVLRVWEEAVQVARKVRRRRRTAILMRREAADDE